ncbi:MAG: hypothetical protein E6H48_12020 [Betaproteobacteria bacterium]|nr:MAG: hypothetical protein E6H48_12020 [Betaproteobacteria bacterium]
MRTFTQRKLDLQLWRRIRTLAIIVVVGGVVVAGEYLPVVHHADAAAATSETVIIAPAEYFPAQFPAPKGEPEAHVEAF